MAVVSKTTLIRLQKSLGTDEKIAKKLKVTRQRIQQLRQEYGIESRYAKNPKRNKKILSLFRSGKKGIEIANKFGLSISQRLLVDRKGTREKEVAKTTFEWRGNRYGFGEQDRTDQVAEVIGSR